MELNRVVVEVIPASVFFEFASQNPGLYSFLFFLILFFLFFFFFFLFFSFFSFSFLISHFTSKQSSKSIFSHNFVSNMLNF